MLVLTIQFDSIISKLALNELVADIGSRGNNSKNSDYGNVLKIISKTLRTAPSDFIEFYISILINFC